MAGILAAISGLPTWSIGVIAVGLFFVGLGVVNALAVAISGRLVPRSEPYHALTRVIEDGRRLRERLSALDTDPTEQEQAEWTVRLKDWNDAADATVARVAPFRLAAFRVDLIIADYPGRRQGRPKQIAQWELDVETTLERLLYIRVTL